MERLGGSVSVLVSNEGHLNGCFECWVLVDKMFSWKYALVTLFLEPFLFFVY